MPELNILDFEYSRSRKIHQNSVFAVFLFLIYDFMKEFDLKNGLNSKMTVF